MNMKVRYPILKMPVFLLSWEEKFDPDKLPFSILCTDLTLDVVTILRYYQVRWVIETGYRYFKELLGFDHYQVRSLKAIERHWVIQSWHRISWNSNGGNGPRHPY